MTPITPSTILLWAQVGDTLIRLGTSTIEKIRGAAGAGSIEADNAQLDKLDAFYDERIARAEAEANRTE